MATGSRFPQSKYALSLLRIIVGFLYTCHGAQKLFGVFEGQKAAMFSLIGLAGILELVGGLLILVGFYTRWTAFILCGEMAVAYFMSHAKHGFWPIVNHGELAVLYCFIFLYLFAAGPGPVSLDRAIRHRE